MTLRAFIADQLAEIAQQQHKTLAPLTDELPLLESGLDSLCLALLVANLEDELEVDPFGSGDVVEMPRTFGELVRIYDQASAG